MPIFSMAKLLANWPLLHAALIWAPDLICRTANYSIIRLGGLSEICYRRESVVHKTEQAKKGRC